MIEYFYIFVIRMQTFIFFHDKATMGKSLSSAIEEKEVHRAYIFPAD